MRRSTQTLVGGWQRIRTRAMRHKGVIGMAVAAAVEPMAVGAAGGDRDRGCATQMRERSLPTQPLRLSPTVPAGGGIDADPGQRDQGSDRGDQGLELGVEPDELQIEALKELGRGNW